MDDDASLLSAFEESDSFRAFLIKYFREKNMTQEQLIEALAESHFFRLKLVLEVQSSSKFMTTLATDFAEKQVAYTDSVLSGVKDMMSGIDAVAQAAFDAGKKKAPTENAHKRHAEHRAMKAEVFKWLDSQPPFRSNEAAASAICRQQPIAHSTARDYFKEWKKSHPASKP